MNRSIHLNALALIAVGALLGFAATRQVQAKVQFAPVPAQTQGKMGEVLPIPRPTYQPTTEQDWRKVQPPPRFEVKPPKGAPNVVIVLMDQSAYADPSGMGGPINTPTFDRLAKEGLTYTNFHVNPLCSPSRVSLLTGRNSHQNSMAGVAGTSSSFPGDTGARRRASRPSGRSCRTGVTPRATSVRTTRSPSTR